MKSFSSSEKASSDIREFQSTIEQLAILSASRESQAIKEAQNQLAKQRKESSSENEFISNTVSIAITAKKLNDETGITLKDWQSLPKEMTRNREFIQSVLINKNILLNKKLQKKLLQLYWKDQGKLLQEHPKLIEGLFTSVLNKTASSGEDRNLQLLQADPVLMHSLTTIDRHLQSVKSTPVQDPREYAENLKGMKQALGTLYEIGGLCRSESLQNTALVLNHGLDLAVGLSQLTGKALPAGFISMGATLGHVGMVVSAVVGIFSLFKKRKKNDNAFAQVILSYLQTISHQIYNMHSDMLRGFELVTENQKKMMDFMMKSVEHLDLLVRAEAQNIHNAVTDLEQHLDMRLDNAMRLTVASGQEIHLQPFYRLMNKIDFYSKDKESVSPDKIKKLNYDLSNWIQRDSHFSANPLHTGTIQLTTQRDDLMHYINSEFKDIEQRPEKVLQNMAFLAQIAEKAFKVSMVQEGKTIDTNAIPNPMIWLHGAGKYIDFRKEFCDVLTEDKDILVSSMAVADNLFNFIKLLQTSPTIYIKLFEAYEAELVKIQAIFQKAVDARNQELQIQRKLPDWMVFDITRDLDETLSENEDELFRHQDMTGEKFQTQFNRFPNNVCFRVELSKYSVDISQFMYKADKIQSTIREQKQNTFLSKALLSHQFGLLNITSNYQLELVQPGGKGMGVLIFKFNMVDPSDVTKKLFDVRYALDGDTNGQQKWHEQGPFYSHITGFDSDFSKNIGEFHSCLPVRYGAVNVNNIVKAYINKKIFNKIEFGSDFKETSTSISDKLNQFVMEKRKEIISDISGARLGRAKEPYQSALKSAYERLDGYKILLKCFASLAGMSEVDSKLDTPIASRLPEAFSILPDSKSIDEKLSNYLDNATIDTPWPVDSLQKALPAAKKSILEAIDQEAQRSLVQIKETKDESTIPGIKPIQFVSPLQIELSMHFYQLLEVLLTLQEQPAQKSLSVQDEQFIAQKYKQCFVHFTLQNEWIKSVDSSWICYDSLQESTAAIQKLLHQDCTDTNEMGRNLPEIILQLLEIHNLLATYHALKQGYPLNIEFAKGISKKLNEIQSKLQKGKAVIPDSKEDQSIVPPAVALTVNSESPRISLPFFKKSNSIVSQSSIQDERQQDSVCEQSNLSFVPSIPTTDTVTKTSLSF